MECFGQLKPVCAKFWPLLEEQIGRHSQLVENNKVYLNLGIFQPASLNWYKRYMARKASLIVILTYFQKQNGHHITRLMSNGVIQLKRPYISPNIAPRGLEVARWCSG